MVLSWPSLRMLEYTLLLKAPVSQHGHNTRTTVNSIDGDAGLRIAGKRRGSQRLPLSHAELEPVAVDVADAHIYMRMHVVALSHEGRDLTARRKIARRVGGCYQGATQDGEWLAAGNGVK